MRQGHGPALGEAEQVRGEARRPGMRGIAAGRWRMAGARGGGGSAQLGLARGERRGTGRREFEEDKVEDGRHGQHRATARRWQAAFAGMARGGAPRARVAGSRCQGKAGWEKTGGARVVWLVAQRVAGQRTGHGPQCSLAHGRRHGEK